MKKEDLKTGMLVLRNDGSKGTIMKGGVLEDHILFDTHWTGLGHYNEDLTFKAETECGYEFSITKVFQPAIGSDVFRFVNNLDTKFPLTCLYDNSVQYPMWFREVNPYTGLVIKFTNLTTGVVVKGVGGMWEGEVYNNLTPHTDKKWCRIPEPEQLEQCEQVKEMTMDEIEKIIGCSVKIVK